MSKAKKLHGRCFRVANGVCSTSTWCDFTFLHENPISLRQLSVSSLFWIVGTFYLMQGIPETGIIGFPIGKALILAKTRSVLSKSYRGSSLNSLTSATPLSRSYRGSSLNSLTSATPPLQIPPPHVKDWIRGGGGGSVSLSSPHTPLL